MPKSNVRRINGVEITGTPIAGEVPIATSATTAEWGTVGSGSGDDEDRILNDWRVVPADGATTTDVLTTGPGGTRLGLNSSCSSGADGTYVLYTGSNTANYRTGFNCPLGTNFFAASGAGKIDLMMTVKTPSDLTNVRYSAGIFEAYTHVSDVQVSTSAYFRFSTSAGDTNLMAVVGPTTVGGPIAAFDTGIPVIANTRHTLRIVISATAVSFYVDGDIVYASTQLVPGSAATPLVLIESVALAASARHTYIGRIDARYY